jgi:hypothetical protein
MPFAMSQPPKARTKVELPYIDALPRGAAFLVESQNQRWPLWLAPPSDAAQRDIECREIFDIQGKLVWGLDRRLSTRSALAAVAVKSMPGTNLPKPNSKTASHDAALPSQVILKNRKRIQCLRRPKVVSPSPANVHFLCQPIAVSNDPASENLDAATAFDRS